MIIAIVVFELIVSFIATLLIGVGNPGSHVIEAPLGVWLICAILQLAIHYRPPGPRLRNGLAVIAMSMLLAGLILNHVRIFPYFNQVMFVAAVAVLPQLLLEWSSRPTTGGRTAALCLVVSLSLPLGLTVWSLANIGIVKIRARLAAEGEPCLLVPDGRAYRSAPDAWSLSGLRMFAGRGSSGSGDCCQWDFHALLLTQDNQLFNWSYRSQSFERLSEQSRHLLGLSRLRC